MNKLAEFFQESNGTFSATRLAFLAWIFGVLIGWRTDTAQHQYKMAEIPQSVQVLIAVLMTGKVAQKFSEEPNTSTTEVQVIEEKRQLIANTGDNSVAAGQRK